MRHDHHYIKLRGVVDTLKIVLFARGADNADACPAEARLEAKR